MNKLEVLITKRESRDRVYVSFPTTRKEIRETLGSIGIVKDDWLIVGVKTGSNPFGEIILSSDSLDELNFLGFWMSQFSEEEYHSFFHLCDVFNNDISSVADCINIAANIKNYFTIRKLKNEEFVGRWMVSEYLKRHDADCLAVWESVGQDYEILGHWYVAEKHGRFFNGDFYGRTENWERVFNGEETDIPEDLLIDSIRI